MDVAQAAKFVVSLLRFTSGPKILKLGSKTLHPDATIIHAIMLSLTAPQQTEFLSLLGHENFTSPQAGARLYDAIRSCLSEAKGVNPAEVYFNDDIKTPLSELIYVINLYNKKGSFLYDPTTDTKYMFDHEVIIDCVKHLLGKEAFPEWRTTNSKQCRVLYRPDVKERFLCENGVTVFNTWEEASWRKGFTIQEYTEKTSPPELFRDFMRALFPDADDRRTVAAWLRDAVFDRAEPILVLSGSPGVGKNVLVENVAAALIGKHNYRSAARGFGKSYFHANVSQCRIFFLDEMNLTHDARESLKAYHNGLATIERKGVDNSDPEPIYASFAIANNYPQYIKLEYSDRKFFVPDLTTTPLVASLGQEKIDKFIDVLGRDDFLRDLGLYLYTNYYHGQSERFKKNDKFRELCLGAYPDAFRRFITACHENSEIYDKKFNRGAGRKLEFLELKRHIDHYETQFNEGLATVVEVEGKWTAISKRYVPSPGNGLDKTPLTNHETPVGPTVVQ